MAVADIKRLRNEGNAACAKQEWDAAEALYASSAAAWEGCCEASLVGEAAAEAAKTYANHSACLLHLDRAAEASAAALRCLRLQPCYARAMLLHGQARWRECERAGRALDAPLWPFVSACALDPRYLAETLRLNVVNGIQQGRRARGNDLEAAAASAAAQPQAWAVRHADESGARHSRRLVATRRLEVGDVILPALLPFSLGADKPQGVCRRCTKEVTNGNHACKKCKTTAWCGKKCRAADEAAHAGECEALGMMAKTLEKVRAVANTFGVSHTQLNGFGYLEGTGDDSMVDVDDLAATATLCLSTALRIAVAAAAGDGDGADAGAWRDVAELEAQRECLNLTGPCARAAVNQAASRVAAEVLGRASLQTQGLVAGLGAALPWLSDKPTPTEVAELFACIVQTNSFEFDGGIALVPPPLAWVNHSCEPNAAKLDSGELRCSRTIEEGAEICTSYIADLMQPRDRRRAALRSLHAFTCGCARCEGAGADAEGGYLRPLADVVRCGACSGGWVCVAEHGEGSCAQCGAVSQWSSVGAMLTRIERDVEDVAPVLHGCLDSMGSVDDELLAKLERIADDAGKVLHPFHWLMHRIHAAMIAPYLSMKNQEQAARHSLCALAAMDATLGAHWVGKAERAKYVAENYAHLPSDTPAYLKTLYTQPVLAAMHASLASTGLV